MNDSTAATRFTTDMKLGRGSCPAPWPAFPREAPAEAALPQGAACVPNRGGWRCVLMVSSRSPFSIICARRCRASAALSALSSSMMSSFDVATERTAAAAVFRAPSSSQRSLDWNWMPRSWSSSICRSCASPSARAVSELATAAFFAASSLASLTWLLASMSSPATCPCNCLTAASAVSARTMIEAQPVLAFMASRSSWRSSAHSCSSLPKRIVSLGPWPPSALTPLPERSSPAGLHQLGFFSTARRQVATSLASARASSAASRDNALSRSSTLMCSAASQIASVALALATFVAWTS
mmetsp:Transcript_59886/g.168788  ORF Transcript_59886/g.168788 Transcript_59886/m.168788 type:complete len:297 (-) Transcript_59886:280-1170(-)